MVAGPGGGERGGVAGDGIGLRGEGNKMDARMLVTGKAEGQAE